jgi:hypothetical protein
MDWPQAIANFKQRYRYGKRAVRISWVMVAIQYSLIALAFIPVRVLTLARTRPLEGRTFSEFLLANIIVSAVLVTMLLWALRRSELNVRGVVTRIIFAFLSMVVTVAACYMSAAI